MRKISKYWFLINGEKRILEIFGNSPSDALLQAEQNNWKFSDYGFIYD